MASVRAPIVTTELCSTLADSVCAIQMVEYWTYALFFCVAELWGPIVISVLFWTLANEVCTVQDARTIYPLMGIAANIALVVAGVFIKHVTAAVPQARATPPSSCSRSDHTLCPLNAPVGYSEPLAAARALPFGGMFCVSVRARATSALTPPFGGSDARKSVALDWLAYYLSAGWVIVCQTSGWATWLSAQAGDGAAGAHGRGAAADGRHDGRQG